MSMVQHPEIGISASQHPSHFDVHRLESQKARATSIADLISGTSASSHGSINTHDHESTRATSPNTNEHSSIHPSQDSSLSSQEMMVDSEERSFARTITPGTTDKANAEQSIPKHTKMDDGVINGIVQARQISRDATIESTIDKKPDPERQIPGSTYKLDTTVGQKRMANGEIKPSSSVSPVNHLGFELSQLSNTSPERSPQRSPHIGQLAAKLRTRLNYAMVKVQHGWESKNINEIESLTQHTSPRLRADSANGSATSPPRRPVGSRDGPDYRLTLSPHSNVLGKRSPDSMSSSSSISDLSYMRHVPLSGQAQKPSLAPAVDLGPRNARRSNSAKFVPPAIKSADVNSPSIPDGESRPGQTAMQWQTSQKPSLAMEQDAIETLLFMSSPGNTQYRPSSQQTSASPYLSPYNGDKQQPKKSNLSGPAELAPSQVSLSRIANAESVPISPQKKLFPDEIDLGNDQSIDKVLDEMPLERVGEESSSDEDDIG